MAEAFNPYAPPAADVDIERQVGGVFRVGKLVRVDRNGALPDRCVTCNAAALPKRVGRRLYWARWEWRVLAWGLPLALLGLGIAGIEVAGMLVMPAVVVLLIVNMLVRKRADLGIGLCARHWRMRRAIGLLGLASSVSILGFTIFTLSGPSFQFLVPASVLATLALGIAYAYTGAQRVAIGRIDEQHVWLTGAGQAFRDALPEPAAE
jgi:hypothetical protein